MQSTFSLKQKGTIIMNNKKNCIASINIHEDIPDTFPLSRMFHCHNVGLRMYSYAKKHLNWTEEKCQDMNSE